jgi:prepilin-type N-terminal cleavage/methylation domain-containing protein
VSALLEAVRRRRRDARDEGFTLIELLVSIVLVSLIMIVVFTSVIAATNATKSSRLVNDLNEEARLVLNRMSRELREAKEIEVVVNPSGPSYAAGSDVKITFHVDFDGDNVIEPAAADPEVLTYRYEAANQRLVLEASGSALPVLAANVSSFSLDFTSRRYTYDGTTAASGGACGTQSAAKDGTIYWWELDGHPSRAVGNCNGSLDTELAAVDSVVIDLKVLYGVKQQQYQTRVDLRNATG